MDLYVDIEVREMTYFSEPVKAIYLRNVSKTISNHDLKIKNSQSIQTLNNIKTSNENVAHEMRSPIGSIITIVDALILKGKRHVGDNKNFLKYHELIKFQA